MATHSSVLAWRISGMEEPGGLPSMGSHRVGHDWSDLAVCCGEDCKFSFFNRYRVVLVTLVVCVLQEVNPLYPSYWIYWHSRRRQWHPTPVLLAWKVPWMEEPGRLQSMGSLRVGHDWATSLWLFNFMHRRRKWQLTPVFLPGESQGQWSLVGCRLWGCTESDTTEAT